MHTPPPQLHTNYLQMNISKGFSYFRLLCVLPLFSFFVGNLRSLCTYCLLNLSLAVPELQGEPEDISKEKARMAASQVLPCFEPIEHRHIHPT